MVKKHQRLNRILVLGSVALIIVAAFWMLNLKPAQAETSERSFLGVYIGDDLDDETRESLKFKGSGGALIDDVTEGGPAEKAGLKEGDIIVSFNETKVENESHLRDLIHKTKPDDEVNIVAFRDGKEEDFTVKMGKSSSGKSLFSWVVDPDNCAQMKKLKYKCVSCGDKDRGWLGIELQGLTEQLGEFFKVKGGKGVLISSVMKDSPAEKAGLKAGDIIVKLDDEEIEESEDLMEELCEKKAGVEVNLGIIRDGKNKQIKVTLGERPEDLTCDNDCGCFSGCGDFYRINKMKDLQILDDFDFKDLQKNVKKIKIELDEPMEELKEELEELRQEIEKLKEKMK